MIGTGTHRTEPVSCSVLCAVAVVARRRAKIKAVIEARGRVLQSQQVARAGLAARNTGHFNAQRGVVRRRALVKALVAYTETHGYPPTLRELAAAAGISTSTTFRHVQTLIDEGQVTMSPNTPRSLVVVEPKEEIRSCQIP